MALNKMHCLQTVTMADLRSGDQVAFKRKVELEMFHPSLRILNSVVGDSYYHHGIFVEPRSIIHQTWSLTDVKATKACKEDIMRLMSQLSIDGTIYKVLYDEGSSLPLNEVVKRAEAMVSLESTEPFNIVTNNCETFAVLLKTGKRRSSQVEAVCEIIKTASPELYSVLSVLFKIHGDSVVAEQELGLD